MSRVVGELRKRVETPPDARLSADDFAQMIVCGFVTVLRGRAAFEQAADWLLASAPDWQQEALREIFAAAFERGPLRGRLLTAEDVATLSEAGAAMFAAGAEGSDGEAEHFYERFLAVHAALERRRKGVFFTPRPIVRFMLAQVDRQLREEFGRSEGIASADVSLLDPAAGTGIFLTEAVTLVHRLHRSLGPFGGAADWNQYVAERLLPRLRGIELMPTSCLLAHLHLTLRLAETGFDFATAAPIRVALGNALSGPEGVERSEPGECLVVLGNPPFSYLSENDSPWIKGLIRGDGGASGYLEFDGERLGERKTWLHDDYVKFLRYAQWRVESAGSGIVGFVTNHGYLDNTTFRLMRRQLLRTFPRISVVDLHGGRKKGEVSPDGSRDENVFGLDQGVAIGLFRLSNTDEPAATIEHAEVWGQREAKLDALERWIDEGPTYQRVVPTGPDYRWVPGATVSPAEYARGLRLPDAMPVYTTAPVTARDGLVVAFTREELLRRIERFCDLLVSDERIRGELFPRSRTARYPAGDTRSWKLSEVRRQLAEETDLGRFVQRCLYRPLDWRFVFWHEAMIDWPRTEVMRHLVGGVPKSGVESEANLALIARRQMLPAQPCTYFWVTDCLTLDGVIRSDNRGSEAVFPQWLVGAGSERTLNLADAASSVGPAFVEYAYALFHAPGYRARYADDLRRDFPRVMLPREEALSMRLRQLGGQLVRLHLLREEPEEVGGESRGELEPGLSVDAGYPRWDANCVWVRSDAAIAKCSEAAWQFRAGGHQVLRKWLVDRRGRLLGGEEVQQYRRMVGAIERTLELLPDIDAAVAEHGGWADAFV